MKKLGLFVLPIFFFLLGAEQTTVEESNEPVCKISYFYGDVARRLPPKEWEKPALDEAVEEGEWLKTGFDSKAELSLIDGSVLRIAENSFLQIEGLDAYGDPVIIFKAVMPRGRLWAKVKKLMKKSVFSVQNPIVVAGVRGTEYRMDVLPDSSTRIRVYKGSVAVKNEPLVQKKKEGAKLEKPHQVPGPHPVPGPHEVSLEEWFVIVKAQQELWVSKTGQYRVSEFSMKEDTLDPWVKWNLERDKKMGEGR